MEQVEYEGVEIDRCSRCNGVWFDEGEVEQLAHKDAATAIDTGSAKIGRRLNTIEEYRCPRCGGEMLQKSDSEQSHIWYETCGDCHGSFFDAGEFRDLAQVTVSDYFKRLVSRKRSDT